MTPERRGPATGAVALSGAAFGAAAVLLGAGAVAGGWPTGWAAAVCALVLAAVGVTVLAATRRTAGGARTPDTDPQDAVPGGCATLLAVRTSDGKVMWKRKLAGTGLVDHALAVGGTTAVAAEPDGRVACLAYGNTIALLEPADGRVSTVLKPDTPELPAVSIRPLLLPVTGGHVVLNRINMSAEPAAFALR
ncbi:hypothetical protein AB0B30_02545 [Streptomyces narbonensis]|uniref:PQQ-binding-like beta-propeller repeat protein n=1 Tax=Streptomyces narbonensis TaxID=67333 RepID=A0ABV3C1K6_9ACTN